MIRNLKALSLALVAVFAFAAVAASSASAATDHLTLNRESSVNLTGTGLGATFGTKSSAIETKCTGEHFTASALANASEITVAPSYTGCTTAPFSGETPVDVESCDFVLTANTTSHNKTTTGTETDAAVGLNCGDGAGRIKITAPGCTITITDTSGANAVNQNLHGVTYDNEGTGETEDVKVTTTVDGIHYTTPGGFFCEFAGLSTTGTDGFLTGSATVKGYVTGATKDDAHQVGITVD
jgi:hypothetical protein